MAAVPPRAGWRYGLKKDPAAKTHPCLVPYWQLPAEQRRKDGLFAAIVAALTEQVAESFHGPAGDFPAAADAAGESVAEFSDPAGKLLYRLSRQIRTAWPRVSEWAAMDQEAALDAVEELAGHQCGQIGTIHDEPADGETNVRCHECGAAEGCWQPETGIRHRGSSAPSRSCWPCRRAWSPLSSPRRSPGTAAR